MRPGRPNRGIPKPPWASTSNDFSSSLSQPHLHAALFCTSTSGHRGAGRALGLCPSMLQPLQHPSIHPSSSPLPSTGDPQRLLPLFSQRALRQSPAPLQWHSVRLGQRQQVIEATSHRITLPPLPRWSPKIKGLPGYFQGVAATFAGPEPQRDPQVVTHPSGAELTSGTSPAKASDGTMKILEMVQTQHQGRRRASPDLSLQLAPALRPQG